MAFNMTHTTPTTGAVAVYQALMLWQANGCTVTKSGDGLASFSGVGTVFTSGGSGAGGLGNTRAWFVVSWGGGEEWCFQRGTDNTSWRIKVSRAASFVGGAPAANQVPSATDEQLLRGSGSDASPTGATVFQADGSYYFAAGIDTAEPRRHWWEAWAIAGSALTSWLWRDVVVPTEATDADIYVRGIAAAATITSASIMGATTGSATSAPYYLGYAPSLTPTVAAHMPLSLPGINGTQTFPTNSATLAISGNDPLAVPRYQRGAAQGAPVVIKGDSTIFAVCGPTRSNGDRFTVASANDRVAFAMVTSPWDNTAVPL